MICVFFNVTHVSLLCVFEVMGFQSFKFVVFSFILLNY